MVYCFWLFRWRYANCNVQMVRMRLEQSGYLFAEEDPTHSLTGPVHTLLIGFPGGQPAMSDDTEQSVLLPVQVWQSGRRNFNTC